MNKPQTYDFEFVREWKIKKPRWKSFMIFWFLNFLTQIVLLFFHKDVYLYGKLMAFVLVGCYIIDGKYPYLKKTKIILTKHDAIRGQDE